MGGVNTPPTPYTISKVFQRTNPRNDTRLPIYGYHKNFDLCDKNINNNLPRQLYM